MFISSVYIRFYRSFNFDYIRADDSRATPSPWDLRGDDLFYPFVKVELEKDVTAVVGANESGKSQLLSAIKCGLTGENIERGDFCRYSRFFAVDESMAYPEFGLEIAGLDEDERLVLKEVCGADASENLGCFAVFRLNNSALKIYLKQDEGWKEFPLLHSENLSTLLPAYFEIDSKIPLPDSVPVEYLVDPNTPRVVVARSHRNDALRLLFDIEMMRGSEPEKQSIMNQVFDIISSQQGHTSDYKQQLELADDLLVKVAGISRTAFAEVLAAIKNGREGLANGLVEQMNRDLQKKLNFVRWWSQDRDFKLLLTLRDLDLVFTIRDRTGTEYSFSERSGGLKYFLSYFVQYLSHDARADGRKEVLLMDEPDAYLSSMGQQDLLRILDAFAVPRDGRKPCQVVYVTHSPFLIDKNHGERIRVLEKGADDDGTRVVSSVSRNHYEPLRSSFGSFVGETTFIGNCNLMLEGISDQILLAGMATRLRNKGVGKTETLDLNNITLVPAGSASQIPYLVYLARGRDVDSPVVIVLLDGDKAGSQAKKDLIKGPPKNKQILDPKWIIQLSDLSSQMESDRVTGVTDIEDLIPTSIAWRAASHYVAEYLGLSQEKKLDKGNASRLLSAEVDVHGAVETEIKRIIGPSFHLDKIGFARSILAVVDENRSEDAADIESVESNFSKLFRHLIEKQNAAIVDGQRVKSGAKIRRLVGRFEQDHPVQALREDAVLLFREIEASLDTGIHNDIIRREIGIVKRRYELDVDLTTPIADYAKFLNQVKALSSVEIRASIAAMTVKTPEQTTNPSPKTARSSA